MSKKLKLNERRNKMKDALVGYTGFVGSNIEAKHKFTGLYNSKNIEDAYGTNPDLLIYAGIPAQKFIANSEPEKDLKTIENAISNIQKINPKKLVLISTIDVYENPREVDEDTVIAPSSEGYGRNRLYLENWVRENISDYHIVRLPALFGKNIKKNFIYDMIHVIPSMLKETKFDELVAKEPSLKDFYSKQDNGFYKCRELNAKEKIELKSLFRKLDFTALKFTDSRASFQFYNLSNLWNDIEKIVENDLKTVNLATEPLSAREIYEYIYKREFINELNGKVSNYDFRTKHARVLGGDAGYIQNREQLLKEIKDFVEKKTAEEEA